MNICVILLTVSLLFDRNVWDICPSFCKDCIDAGGVLGHIEKQCGDITNLDVVEGQCVASSQCVRFSSLLSRGDTGPVINLQSLDGRRLVAGVSERCPFSFDGVGALERVRTEQSVDIVVDDPLLFVNPLESELRQRLNLDSKTVALAEAVELFCRLRVCPNAINPQRQLVCRDWIAVLVANRQFVACVCCFERCAWCCRFVPAKCWPKNSLGTNEVVLVPVGMCELNTPAIGTDQSPYRCVG